MNSNERLECTVFGQRVDRPDGAPGVRGCAHVLWGPGRFELPTGRDDAAAMPFDVQTEGIFPPVLGLVFAGRQQDIEPYRLDTPPDRQWFSLAIGRALRRYIIVGYADPSYEDAQLVPITTQEVENGYCIVRYGDPDDFDHTPIELGPGGRFAARLYAGAGTSIVIGPGDQQGMHIALAGDSGAYALAVHRAYFRPY